MLEFVQKNIKWIIPTVAFLFGIGVAWGVLEYKVSTMQKQIDQLSTIKEDVDIIKGQNDILLENFKVLLKERVRVDQ